MTHKIIKGNLNSTLNILIAHGPKGIERVEFGNNVKKFLKALPDAEWKVVSSDKKVDLWLNDYCKGKFNSFPYKLNPSGTEFQKDVWKTLQKIPYGEVRTYKWVAEKVGRPNAVRAVGTACGANPIPFVIPCHRVVASNGLGGFSSGIQIKKKLLTLEGHTL